MIAKLPRWALYGGVVPAFIANMVISAAGYLGCRHQALTHATGTTSLPGIAVVQGDAADLLHFVAFMLGCAVFIGFRPGGVAGGLVFPHWQENTLLSPAVLTGLAGIAYTIYRHRHGPDVVV